MAAVRSRVALSLHTRRATALVVALALLASPPPVAAQAQGYVANVDVTVVDLAVVVRDGEKPVTRLRPENFSITSNGVEQEITNFREVHEAVTRVTATEQPPATAPPAAPSPPPVTGPEPPPAVRNRIVVFFDNLHLHPGRRDAAIKHVERVLGDLLNQGTTETMVVTFLRELSVLQTFTANRGSLSTALQMARGRAGGAGESLLAARNLQEQLNRLAEDLGAGDRYADYESEPFQQMLTFVTTYAESEEHDLQLSLQGLGSVLDMLLGVEGRKAILVVSDGLKLQPGEDAFAFLDAAFPNANARLSGTTYDRTREFKRLTDRANRQGVSLYVVSTGRQAYRGIVTADRAKPVDARFRGLTLDDFGQTEMKRAADFMASETGGISAVGVGNIGKALDRVAGDFESYYSIGFQPTGAVDEDYPITVKLKNVPERYTLRYRRAYAVLSERNRLERSVTAAFSRRREENPLEADADLQILKATGNGEIGLQIKVKVPWKNLLLTFDGKEHKGDLEARLAFQNERGETSDVRTLHQPLVLPEPYFQAAQSESYTYLIEFSLPPGRWLISLALTDGVSRNTSYFRFARPLARQ